MRAAGAAGLGRAVVSASANTRDVLEAAGIADLFEVRIDGIVAAEQHLRGKPAPDTFLAAAKVLEVDASGDAPVAGVTVRYDYPVGGEGVCGTAGRLVARISPGALSQATKRYKVRVRRKQVNGTIHGVPVQPSDAVPIP